MSSVDGYATKNTTTHANANDAGRCSKSVTCRSKILSKSITCAIAEHMHGDVSFLAEGGALFSEPVPCHYH